MRIREKLVGELRTVAAQASPENAASRCAKCGMLTALKILMPSFKPGYEERLFECSACGYAETVFIKL